LKNLQINFLHEISTKNNHIKFLEYREEINSQSSSSSTTTSRSNATNSSQNDRLTGHKRTKKQQRVSIGPTAVAKKPTSLAEITNHLSQPPPATTVESHFNPNEFSVPPVPTRRIPSPIISSSSSSSDTAIENNLINRSRSTTPTPSPTFNQSPIRFTSDHNTPQTDDMLKHHSTNDNRPPARLEKRRSPPFVSPERPIKNKEETDENDALAFFD